MFSVCTALTNVSVSDLEKKAVLITGCSDTVVLVTSSQRSSILEVYRFLLGVSLQTDKQS